MSPQAPTIKLTDLTFGYSTRNGRLSVLESVNLSVRPREIVALVGPSGCGKSTLLNLVAGLLEPSAGHIFVGGSELANRLGRFSYMPQRDLLLPWRTALDNAALLLEIRGMPLAMARMRAGEMLDRFGLTEFKDSLPAQLSGGMRQRVALVRSFLPNANVLLDEPFGALDAITRGELQEWLLLMQADAQRSILLVTHDIDEAVFLADRVLVMSPRPGRVITEVEIKLPRPRKLEITTTVEFSGIKSRIFAVLRESMRSKATAA